MPPGYAGSNPVSGTIYVVGETVNTADLKLASHYGFTGSIPVRRTKFMEGIRPDEEAVLKTVARKSSGFKSSVFRQV